MTILAHIALIAVCVRLAWYFSGRITA